VVVIETDDQTPALSARLTYARGSLKGRRCAKGNVRVSITGADRGLVTVVQVYVDGPAGEGGRARESGGRAAALEPATPQAGHAAREDDHERRPGRDAHGPREGVRLS
jgi:hypothetical protein